MSSKSKPTGMSRTLSKRAKTLKKRCAWAEMNPIFFKYHDNEWGVPLHDDRRLFEMLNLEGAQAGLSWLTILQKRDNYRELFDRFNAAEIIKYNAAKKAALLKNPGIVRNRLKVDAFIQNARVYLAVKKEWGSFDAYIWQFHGQKAEFMSKEMKKKGFKFVGPTICYAFMQAVGMVDGHTRECFKFNKI